MPDAQWSDPVTYRPIGVIHSPHKRAAETPIQPVYAEGVEGTAEVFEELEFDLMEEWRSVDSIVGFVVRHRREP